jgi:hypothetical protein
LRRRALIELPQAGKDGIIAALILGMVVPAIAIGALLLW